MKIVIIICVLTFTLHNSINAVEANSDSTEDNFTVMGILGASNKNHNSGVVVIKNNEALKTHTLQAGDIIPSNKNYKIAEINTKNIIIQNRQGNKYTLEFNKMVATRYQSPEEENANEIATSLDEFYQSQDDYNEDQYNYESDIQFNSKNKKSVNKTLENTKVDQENEKFWYELIEELNLQQN